MDIDSSVITIIVITLIAAMINGALGHGFSTLTVPVALLFHTNRVLNPALVLIEIVINTYVLVINRASVPRIWRRVMPIIIGLVPGILLGSYLLSFVDSNLVKVLTYTILLPLILLQAGGCRIPIRSEKMVGVPFGGAVGVAYSLTTISGPPLACMFNNQGYAQRDFRAALGLIRTIESTLTAIAYAFLGLYSYESTQLLYLIIPSVVVGIPLGTFLIRHLDAETFRRVCISFDAWVISFGLSRALIMMSLLASPMAYSILLATILIDSSLLYRYFMLKREYAEATLSCRPQAPPTVVRKLKHRIKGEVNASSKHHPGLVGARSKGTE